MDIAIHDIESLFEQLGLEHTQEAVAAFIRKHRPLPSDVELHKAPFWSASQASFLKQAIADDADWAEVVDQLNAMLR